MVFGTATFVRLAYLISAMAMSWTRLVCRISSPIAVRSQKSVVLLFWLNFDIINALNTLFLRTHVYAAYRRLGQPGNHIQDAKSGFPSNPTREDESGIGMARKSKKSRNAHYLILSFSCVVRGGCIPIKKWWESLQNLSPFPSHLIWSLDCFLFTLSPC